MGAIREAWVVLLLTFVFSSHLIAEIHGESGTMYWYNGFETDPVGSYDHRSTPPKGFEQCDVGPGNVTLIDNQANARTGKRYTLHEVPVGKTPTETAFALFLKRWYTDRPPHNETNAPDPYEWPQLYVRWSIKFVDLPATYGDIVRLFYFMYLWENSSAGYYNNYGTAGIVTLAYSGDQYTLGFGKLWGAPDQSAKLTLTTDQWHTFEVWYRRGIDGEWKLWLDGDLLFSASGDVEPPIENDVNWKAYGVHGFDVGLYAPYDNSANCSLLMDDVVFADYRFGPAWIPPETTSVTILVLDNRTGNYVSDARLRINSFEAHTNASGTATFTGIATFSDYTLSVSRMRFHTSIVPVTVYETDPRKILFLEPVNQSTLIISARARARALFGYSYETYEIVSMVEISDVNETFETPFSFKVYPGTYRVKATYNDQTITMERAASEGQTYQLEFEFNGDWPPETKIVALVIIIVISIAGTVVVLKHSRD